MRDININVLKRKIPNVTIFSMTVIAFLGLGVSYASSYVPLHAVKNVNFSSIFINSILPPIAFSCFVEFIILRSSLSYRIRYDENAVYCRFFSFKLLSFHRKEMVMSYSDIECVTFDWWWNISQNQSTAAREPFVRFYRKDWDGEEIFALCGEYLDRKEMKNLLRRIYQRYPDIFSQEVVDYLDGNSMICEGVRQH